jgi:type IV pilus assembly protein PilC
MPTFHYQARDAAGQSVSGELDATSLAQAVSELESRELVIVSIGTTPLAPPPSGENPFPGEGSAQGSTVQQVSLERHLARVMEQCCELLPALRAYAQELPAGPRRRELESVLQVLERGDASAAAATLTKLPGYWIPLLAAASASRDPGRVLREFIAESERASQLSHQWWLAIAYPALLSGLAFTVLVLLSVFVIPIFREIFLGFDLRLPAFTILVLSIAQWISSGQVLIWAVAIIVGLWLLPRAARLVPESIRNWCGDHFPLRWGRSTALARLSQFTADLLEAQLDPPQALRLAGQATGNAPIRRAADRAAMQAEAGGDFASPPVRKQLTATILHALGQDNCLPAARIRLLREISAGYAGQARRRLSWTRGIIEPLAICAIGIVVGATVIALFLPLVTLVEGLS